jgi:hypothetical protein
MTDTNTTAEPVSNTQAVFDVFAAQRKGSPGAWAGNRRVVLPSTESALAMLQKIFEKLAPNEGDEMPVPTVTAGLNADGDFGPAYDDADVAVTLLSTSPEYAGRGEARKLVKPAEAIALVTYPQPRLDTFLAAEEGRKFIERLLHKDCQLAALRPCRKADVDFDTVANQMPTTAADYWTASERESSALDSATTKRLTAVLADARAQVATIKRLWDRKLLKLDTFILCIRSKSFALEAGPDFASLEEVNANGTVVSIWERIASKSLDSAREAGLTDYVETVEEWLANRDTFTVGATGDDAAEPAQDDFAAFLA